MMLGKIKLMNKEQLAQEYAESEYQYLRNLHLDIKESFLAGYEAAEPKEFTKEDMLWFAHYLRNGLTNLEYCEKEHEGHLEDWQEYKKNNPPKPQSL